MSNRMLVGIGAALAALLTFIQLVWLYGLMSPASVLGGTANGAMAGSLIAAWFWMSLAGFLATAITLCGLNNNAA